jgi:hypothetical protein
MTNEWRSIMFAPRDGRSFEAYGKRGIIFSCRYNLMRRAFVNTVTNHRVSPVMWRPLWPPASGGDQAA